MSKANSARFGALAFLILGIGIGYIAAKGGFSETEPATAQSPNAKERLPNTGRSEQLAQAATAAAQQRGVVSSVEQKLAIKTKAKPDTLMREA